MLTRGSWKCCTSSRELITEVSFKSLPRVTPGDFTSSFQIHVNNYFPHTLFLYLFKDIFCRCKQIQTCVRPKRLLGGFAEHQQGTKLCSKRVSQLLLMQVLILIFQLLKCVSNVFIDKIILRQACGTFH